MVGKYDNKSTNHYLGSYMQHLVRLYWQCSNIQKHASQPLKSTIIHPYPTKCFFCSPAISRNKDILLTTRSINQWGHFVENKENTQIGPSIRYMHPLLEPLQHQVWVEPSRWVQDIQVPCTQKPNLLEMFLTVGTWKVHVRIYIYISFIPSSHQVTYRICNFGEISLIFLQVVFMWRWTLIGLSPSSLSETTYFVWRSTKPHEVFFSAMTCSNTNQVSIEHLWIWWYFNIFVSHFQSHHFPQLLCFLHGE